MRVRLITGSLVLALLACASVVAAQVEKKATGPKSAAQPTYDFRALMQRILDVWGTLDPNKAAAFYAQEPGLVFYDITPLKYTSWAEYAEGVKKIFSDYSSARGSLYKDAQVHQHGNLAWGTATCRLNAVKKDGAKEALDARWTVVWEKRGSNWIIVHEHFSVPLPSPPPKK